MSLPARSVRRRRIAAVAAVGLVFSVLCLLAPQAATADDDAHFSGGYSLDCSGEVPVLSFSGEITSDNQGRTSGNTNVYFHITAPGGAMQTYGPTVVPLPSLYNDSWTLTGGEGRYLYGMKVGDGARGEDARDLFIPEYCAAAPETEVTDLSADASCLPDGTGEAYVSYTLSIPEEQGTVYVRESGLVGVLLPVPRTAPGGTYTSRQFGFFPGEHPIGVYVYAEPEMTTLLAQAETTVTLDCGPTPTPSPTPTSTSTPTPGPTATDTPASDLAVTLSRTVVAPGGQLTVSGTGFGAGETVQLWLHFTPVKLGDATAGTDDSFAETVTVPVGAELGAHRIEVRRADAPSVWVSLTVTGELAATGAPTAAAIWLGSGAAGLVLAGIAGVVIARRARRGGAST